MENRDTRIIYTNHDTSQFLESKVILALDGHGTRMRRYLVTVMCTLHPGAAKSFTGIQAKIIVP